MTSNAVIAPILLSFILGSAVPRSAPLVCNVTALTPPQRARHAALSEKIRQAAAGRTDLPNGFAFSLDFSRLPLDAEGEPFCVVELAQWVDLESRCCPFLEFGIDVRPEGGGVSLRLTGGPGVKEFLAKDFPVPPKTH